MEDKQDFEFILPLNNGDLLNSRGDQFYVQEVYTSAEIPKHLQTCKTKLHLGDPFYIFEHFDTFYSIIELNTNDASAPKYLLRSFDLLYVTVDKLATQLMQLLTQSEPLSPTDRQRWLNLVKMTLYLFVNTVKRIDVGVHKAVQEQQLNQQKKRGKQVDEVESYPDWDVKRGKFLVQLYNVLQCPLEKLWNPPIADENFVCMICDICYRTLELVPPRNDNQHILDSVFQIFGTAIKRYNHAITFPARILQILRSTEHAANAIANGIVLLNEQYNISSVFSIIVKDMVEELLLDSSDSSLARNFSHFLTEYSAIAPQMIIPHLSKQIDELLDCESHVLRNCVLQIMGDAVVSELTSEELSEELKETRNEFLDNLLAHIMDISAHVRTKVLNVWHRLKEEHAIPLVYNNKVLSGAVGRLDDKSSLVRKSAIQLIKAFLENNPFAGKLQLEELIKEHEKQVQIMDELNDVLVEEREKVEKLESEWEELVPEILPIIEQNLREFPELEYDKEEIYDDLVRKALPLILEKSYSEALVVVRKADYVQGNHELSKLLSPEERCVYYLALYKTFLTLAKDFKSSVPEMQKQIKTVQFLKDSIEFAHTVAAAIPKITHLLMSKTNSDVFEAVDLFTTGYLFGIRGTEAGMQRMLLLVWNPDKEKRDAVSNAYSRVLFTSNLEGRAHAIKVVQNLSNFLATIEYGHYTALEVLMGEWVESDDIDALVIQVLYERFTLKLEGTSDNEARLALQLLIMASQSKSTIASANRAIIEDICTGQRAKRDPRIFTSCLKLLVNAVNNKNNNHFYKRCAGDNKFVQEITSMFFGFFFHPQLPDFDALAMSLLEYYYRMCQGPDLLAEQLIRELLKRFTDSWIVLQDVNAGEQPELPLTQTTEVPYSQPLPQSQSQTLSQTQSQPTQSQQQQQARMRVYLVTRFIFCVGYMTIKEMIFLDIDVYNNMKYREELTAAEEKNKRLAPAALNTLRRQTINSSAMEVRKRLSNVAAEPQQEPDEDLVGATAEDNIAEEINTICEDMLLYNPDAYLSKIYPIIIEICKRPGEYRNAELQQSATLALARLMTVSSKFCESNMSFLMNILGMTKNMKIKCNTVVGLSDLTFRFPNIIDPWTKYFYAQLHEKDTDLRLTAVKMLSHLILHEMIRVKGQIADLAVCIVDESAEIRDITQQFFKEIANKSNILYNVLPDIISKLGDINLHLHEDKYRTIMRYVLGLIQKDRQIETLVEKLCLRFPVARVERQWRDIGYCLSLLSYNERAIKKLIDNVQHYRDKVQVDEVYSFFKLIISNTNKLAKPELKAVVAEFETRLNECLQVNEPGEAAGNEAGATTNETRVNRTKAPSRPGTKPRGRRAAAVAASSNTTRRGRNTRVESSSEEQSDDSDENSPPPAARSQKQQQPPQSRRKKTAANSSESEEEVEQQRSSTARNRSSRARR
ncbi:CAP-D2 [Drosophila busckii]|uniref:Condensin complex subunit 1 n=1 Tax=Drosophila busckii TaxID=30019 RepID=A0A0M5J6X5_DROBS|nr:condensin complex subunit 1 [Drosophila busckii]ALC40848.1 CAP-D2 [Drosophila busckii]